MPFEFNSQDVPRQTALQLVDHLVVRADDGKDHSEWDVGGSYLRGRGEQDAQLEFGATNTSQDVSSILEKWKRVIQDPSVDVEQQDAESFRLTLPWLPYSYDGSYLTYSASHRLQLIYSETEDGLWFILEDMESVEVRRIIQGDVSHIIESILTKDPLTVHEVLTWQRTDLVMLIGRFEKIRTILEDRYVGMVVEQDEYVHKVSDIIGECQNFSHEILVKDVMPILPNALRDICSQYRRDTIGHMVEAFRNDPKLVDFDFARSHLHRRIEALRFVLESGVPSMQTRIDLEMKILAKKGVKYDLGHNITGTWLDGNKLSVIFGLGETSSMGVVRYDGSQGAAHDPRYTSVLDSKRTRDDDVQLCVEISEAIRQRYPLIVVQNNLRIRGSSHERFAGNELMISVESLAAQAAMLSLEIKDFLPMILQIISQEIEKVFTE